MTALTQFPSARKVGAGLVSLVLLISTRLALVDHVAFGAFAAAPHITESTDEGFSVPAEAGDPEPQETGQKRKQHKRRGGRKVNKNKGVKATTLDASASADEQRTATAEKRAASARTTCRSPSPRLFGLPAGQQSSTRATATVTGRRSGEQNEQDGKQDTAAAGKMCSNDGEQLAHLSEKDLAQLRAQTFSIQMLAAQKSILRNRGDLRTYQGCLQGDALGTARKEMWGKAMEYFSKFVVPPRANPVDRQTAVGSSLRTAVGSLPDCVSVSQSLVVDLLEQKSSRGNSSAFVRKAFELALPAVEIKDVTGPEYIRLDPARPRLGPTRERYRVHFDAADWNSVYTQFYRPFRKLLFRWESALVQNAEYFRLEKKHAHMLRSMVPEYLFLANPRTLFKDIEESQLLQEVEIADGAPEAQDRALRARWEEIQRYEADLADATKELDWKWSTAVKAAMGNDEDVLNLENRRIAHFVKFFLAFASQLPIIRTEDQQTLMDDLASMYATPRASSPEKIDEDHGATSENPDPSLDALVPILAPTPKWAIEPPFAFLEPSESTRTSRTTLPPWSSWSSSSPAPASGMWTRSSLRSATSASPPPGQHSGAAHHSPSPSPPGTTVEQHSGAACMSSPSETRTTSMEDLAEDAQQIRTLASHDVLRTSIESDPSRAWRDVFLNNFLADPDQDRMLFLSHLTLSEEPWGPAAKTATQLFQKNLLEELNQNGQHVAGFLSSSILRNEKAMHRLNKRQKQASYLRALLREYAAPKHAGPELKPEVLVGMSVELLQNVWAFLPELISERDAFRASQGIERNPLAVEDEIQIRGMLERLLGNIQAANERSRHRSSWNIRGPVAVALIMFPTPDAKALFHSSTQWKKVHNILFGQKGKQLEEIVSTFVTAETSKSKPIGRFPRKPSQNLSHFAVLVHNWFNYNGSVPRINEIDTSAPHHQRCARSSARNREASSAAPDDRRNTGKKKVAPPRSSDPAVRRVAAGETRPDVARAPDVPPGLVAGPGVPASDEVKCYLQQPPPPPAAGLELPFWYKGQEIKDIADVAKYVL